MTNIDKIKVLDVWIALLKSRSEMLNTNIIKKLERKKRAILVNI